MTNENANTTDDWMAKWRVEEARRVARIPVNKATLFVALKAAGITEVHVEFDGEGDSGQVESPTYRAGETVAPTPHGNVGFERANGVEQMTINEAVEHLAYECLDADHGGWENNDGAYGEIIFDVEAGKITLEMNTRYTETSYDEHEY
jgi:hypothetical protein